MPLIQCQHLNTDATATSASMPSYISFSSNDIKYLPMSEPYHHPDTIIHPSTDDDCDDDNDESSYWSFLTGPAFFTTSPSSSSSSSSPKPIPYPLTSSGEQDWMSKYEEEKEYYNSLTWAMYKRIINGRKRLRERAGGCRCPCLDRSVMGAASSNRVDECHQHCDQTRRKNDHPAVCCMGELRSNYAETEGGIPPSLLVEEDIFFLEI